MGASHPSAAERLGMDASGLPVWYRPPGTKTKFDFPKAREGGPDRYEFTIGERKAGLPRRLDKYLMERFHGYARSFLQKLIKDGSVLINGHAVKSRWHVSVGERVTVLLPPGRHHEPEDIPFEVLHEDRWMIALLKPARLIVHPARGHLTGTLYHGLLHYFREKIAADPSFHIGTVHRLDEETSGVMVYALDLAANQDLTRQFENRLVRKTYLCLVHGAPPWESQELDAPLGVDPTCRVRAAVNGLDARLAQTRFERLSVSPDGRFALLRAFPRTGRSHQIRCHGAALGYPIVGDELYGGSRDPEVFVPHEPRVCLHAESLALTHPGEGYPMVLRAAPPSDFRDAAACMGLALPAHIPGERYATSGAGCAALPESETC